jgi:hypothetical protein
MAKLRASLAAAESEAERLRASLAALEASHTRAPAKSEHLELRRQLAQRQRRAASAATAAVREAEELQALETAATSLCASLGISLALGTDAIGKAVPPSLTQMLIALEGWQGEAQFAADARALKGSLDCSECFEPMRGAAAAPPRRASVSDFLAGTAKPTTPERRPSASDCIHSAVSTNAFPADRPDGSALGVLMRTTAAPPAAAAPAATAPRASAFDFMAVGGSAARPRCTNACSAGSDAWTPTVRASATGG